MAVVWTVRRAAERNASGLHALHDRVEVFPPDPEAQVLLGERGVALRKVERQAGIDVHRGVQADGALFCPRDTEQLCEPPGGRNPVARGDGDVVKENGHGVDVIFASCRYRWCPRRLTCRVLTAFPS
ncbi:hypothetical protein [Variovorax rhizosphaerae]|uniref:K Homology domain-containing protein n=1 Tax=Variovorax rhizosphaerae TaxID=1836200 RepID=A0ABU8WL06_9BURK